MVEILILKSALKHGILERQIREVLSDSSTKNFEIHEDLHGNPQEMLVGYTHAGLLLEVAVRYTDKFDCVFHARRASAIYKLRYWRQR
jgi:hypothetical protein